MRGTQEWIDAGGWIVTHSGVRFDILEPRAELVLLEDIAHALGRVCRYGGHVTHFYTVAQHCCIVADHLPGDLKVEGLLHDATEAYLGDMPSPIKKVLPDYKEMEARLDRVIRQRFNLPEEETIEVKQADRAILIDECVYLFPNHGGIHGAGMKSLDLIGIEPWSPEQATEEFLIRAENLGVH